MLTNKQVVYTIQRCNDYAAQSPTQLYMVGCMVLLSIKQSWHNIGHQLQDVYTHSSKSKYAFGFKSAGINYLDKHKEHLFAAMFTTNDDVELMDIATSIPGMGLAKAGFFVQLVRGSASKRSGLNDWLYGRT